MIARSPINNMNRINKIWEYGLGRTIVTVICIHSVSISIGICQGYSAILIPQLYKNVEYDLDTEQMSWIASLGVITNPFGSILSGLLADYYGRKLSIQLSTIPFILGWLCIAFSTNINYLYAGRLVTGVAAGMSAACYTYVSEISEPCHRGVFQSLGPVCASFGILFTYIMGSFCHWQYVALISVIFATFTAITVQFLPETPPYLVRSGQESSSFDALLWFRRSNAQAQQEYQKLVDQHKKDTQNCNPRRCANFEHFFRPSTTKPFCILVILFFLQEMSGIYTILFYAVNFFEEANLPLDENVSSIIVGVIRFAMSIVAAFLINKYSRKALCMVSSGGMALSLGAILLSVQLDCDSGFLQLAFILLNVLFSMTGMLPIPWILVGEMFPLAVRSIMAGVVICIAQCFIFLSVKIYPDMIANLSFQGTVGVFGIASLVGLIFIKLFLPETKNKTFQEIEEYFTCKSGETGKKEGRGFACQHAGFDLEQVKTYGKKPWSEYKQQDYSSTVSKVQKQLTNDLAHLRPPFCVTSMNEAKKELDCCTCKMTNLNEGFVNSGFKDDRNLSILNLTINIDSLGNSKQKQQELTNNEQVVQITTTS